jgi:hypothetical protein
MEGLRVSEEEEFRKGLGSGGQGCGSRMVSRGVCNALPTPQLSLDLFYTEEEIYELSYAREPRCPKILVRCDL